MNGSVPVRLTRFAPIILPIAVVFCARLMTFTEWAAAHTTLATLLFVWLVADSLMLAAIAKAPGRRPGLRGMLGAFALASVVIFAGASAPVRTAIFAMPALLFASAGTIVLFAGWSVVRVFAALREGRSVEEALGTVLPPQFLRFVMAEFRIMRLALFSWGRPQDIPAGARGFSYHRYLVPMIAVLLALQAIELSVMHLLLMQWNETVAWAFFGLGIAGGLWIVGLAKSFQLYPVLLTDEGIRIRGGALVDALVPYASVAERLSGFGQEQVKTRTTLNQAVLSWPNVVLRLEEPMRIRPLIGTPREVDMIALRVDDSAAFVDELEARIPGLKR